MKIVITMNSINSQIFQGPAPVGPMVTSRNTLEILWEGELHDHHAIHACQAPKNPLRLDDLRGLNWHDAEIQLTCVYPDSPKTIVSRVFWKTLVFW